MLVYFSLTLFVSALLLFLVQPMIGKMLLPRLGGTPAVWNTCMVFFQGVLLAGYAYTHFLSTSLPRRRQFLVQGLLLFTPFVFVLLPFTLGNWQPPTETNPIFAVFWLLLFVVGLPFLIVSTSAPLLQKWFVYTGHPAAKDPYFLYGASNLGSMLALVIYPLVIEPNLSVEEQARFWTFGYLGLMMLVLGCIVVLWRAREPIHVPLHPAEPIGEQTLATSIQVEKPFVPVVLDPAPTWGRRLRWIGLAAAPSSLMLGVTSYMTTDIAAVPLFWVIPLGLYLLTFILVFARWPIVWTDWPHLGALYLHPCLLLLLSLQILAQLTPRYMPMQSIFALHLLTFLCTALVCHGELAVDRPSWKYLTEFYLCMSIGGVLGGLFNALVAPVWFQYGIHEYPVALVFGYLLRPNLVDGDPVIPGDSTARQTTGFGTAISCFAPILLMVTFQFIYPFTQENTLLSLPIVLGCCVIIIFMMLNRPMRFSLALGALFFIVLYSQHQSLQGRTYRIVFEGRDFFNLIRVTENTQRDGTVYRSLVHGGINHGSQIVEPISRRRDPITYFHPTNGVNHIFDQFHWSDARLPTSLIGQADPWGMLVTLHSEPAYAVIGLGTGALACHARPLQHVDFYEISPLVKRLSLPPVGEEPIFYYLHDAKERQANLNVILGDGRLQIVNRGPKHYYHVISLDAFTSDAIPVHLLTAEAIDAYLENLAEGGVLIFNATNRYVDIKGVLSAIAVSRNLECLHCADHSEEVEDKSATDWIVLQRKPKAGTFRNGCPPLPTVLDMRRWQTVAPLEGPVWSDSYSNLFKVLFR